MKRLLTTSIFLLLLAHCPYAFGQDTTKAKHALDDADEDYGNQAPAKKKRPAYPYGIGIEAGINEAFLNQSGHFNNPVLGLRAGAFVYIPVAGHFVIQPGLSFAMNGGTNMDGSILLNTYRYNSLELPLNFGFRYGHHKVRRTTFIGVGPFVSYNLGGTNKDEQGGGTDNLSIGNEANNDFRPFDYGIGLSTSDEYAFGLFIRTRFQYGLANMSPDTEFGTVHSFSLGIQIGYLIGPKPQMRHKPHPRRDDDYIERGM